MAFQELTLAQASKLLGCKPEFLRQQATQHGLPHRMQGDEMLFDQEELLNWSSVHLLEARQEHKQEKILCDTAQPACLLPSCYCQLACVSTSLPGRSKSAILKHLTELAAQSGFLYDQSEFLESLRQREEQASTALPGGVAFVHPCSRDEFLFEESFICLAKSEQPIYFGEADGKTSDIFFVIACRDELHLPILGCLGRLVSEGDLLEQLREAESAEEMLQALKNAENSPACKKCRKNC
ncbi:MAG: PTS transporter subunit EIIA [Oligosphaeraceae bacterium]|nr:PTS transporter subunit EIIA [Oligosphaeraceae bacterium]